MGDVAQNSIKPLVQPHTSVAGAVLTRIDVKKHAKLAFGDAEQHYKQYRRYYIDGAAFYRALGAVSA